MLIKTDSGELEIIEGSHIYFKESATGADVFRDWSELGGDFHHKFESLAADAEELLKASSVVADKARREGMN